jgi:MtrB/PioB family decaheme-associated outer membrane protein
MTTRSLAHLLVLLLVATPAVADEFDLLGVEEGLEESESTGSEPPTAVQELDGITLKLSYVSDDNFAYSKYRDAANKGLRFGADFQGRFADTWTVDAGDLGLHSQWLDLKALVHNDLQLALTYQETPWHGNNSGVTPFSGSSSLTLPGDWQAGISTTDFSNSPFTFDRELLRKELGIALGKGLTDSISINARINVEDKSGTELKGLSIYTNAANPQAVLLPTPVDQTTTQFNISIDYGTASSGADLRLFLTDFDNRIRQVSWQNPYASGLGNAVDYPAGTGAYAASPDHDHRGYAAALAYRFANGLQFNIDVSETATKQQDDLLPYSVNAALPVSQPLPEASPDAELHTGLLNMALSMAPAKGLRLDLRYRHAERENKIARFAWQYIRGDGGAQPGADFSVYNRPLHGKTDLWVAKASYRIAGKGKLRLSYEFEERYRNYAAVTKTEEDRYTVQFDTIRTGKPGSKIQHHLKAGMADLAGSTYEWSRSFFQLLPASMINQIPADQRWINHPLLRQFHVANQRKRDFQYRATWQPVEPWLVQLQAQSRKTDFDRSELGLNHADSTAINFNLSYIGDSHYTAWLALSYSNDDRQQSGRDFGSGLQKPANRLLSPLPQGSDPTRNYIVDTETDTLTATLGMNWRLNEKLSIASNYSQVNAYEDYMLRVSGARDLTAGNLPRIKHHMYTLNTTVNYLISDKVQMSFQHQYFSYQNDNWHYEDTTPDTMSKVLGSGQQNPDEVVNVITLAMSYWL